MSAAVDWILWLLTLALCGGCLLLGFILGRDSGRRSAESHAGRPGLPATRVHPALPERQRATVLATDIRGITGAAGSRAITRDGS